ncbi:hypothetical protein [Nostoc sp.]|uniref:hypothetical protein n=1 Tax=Nostoc sp. TaxID=1180 RepID=UPI002FFB6AA0
MDLYLTLVLQRLRCNTIAAAHFFIYRTYAQVTENRTAENAEKPVRPSPLALASPFGRRGDAKGDAVKRLVPLLKSQLRAASPLGEATGATRRNKSFREFLRKS